MRFVVLTLCSGGGVNNTRECKFYEIAKTYRNRLFVKRFLGGFVFGFFFLVQSERIFFSLGARILILFLFLFVSFCRRQCKIYMYTRTQPPYSKNIFKRGKKSLNGFRLNYLDHRYWLRCTRDSRNPKSICPRYKATTH